MTGWNYRLVDWEETHGDFLAIHEVYYDDQGNPEYWTQDPVCVSGANLQEVLEQLETMKNDVSARSILKKSELPGG